jgi:hypothetical protein
VIFLLLLNRADYSIKKSIITAFDIVQNVFNEKHIHYLLLRSAYIYLVRVIDIYRAAAAKDRVEGQASQEVGALNRQLAYT